MSHVHYIFIVLFLFLTISKDTRKAALVFLASYFIYQNLIIPSENLMYYRLCALLSLCIGLLLIKSNFIVGCLSLFLIPTNLIGYFLYVKYYEPVFYDNMALTIVFLQIIILIIRSLHGVFNRSFRDRGISNIFRLLMVCIVNADSNKKDKIQMEEVA